MDVSVIFKRKRITILGLGLLGRGLGDAKFLAEQGADVVVTDLKTEAELAPSVEMLRGFTNVTFHLGGHDLADFRDRDFILKGPNVPIDSPYIAEARKNGIPIKMSASWFAEIAAIPLVGVTGTRGKSTTTQMLFEIMKGVGMDVLLGGNIRGISTLALLSEVKSDSIALMELDSWQLAGFGECGISPQISVFTTFYPDHLNYYGTMDAYLADKTQIFLHQKPEDTLVVSTQVAPILKEKYGKKIVSRVVIGDPAKFPKGWKLKIPGGHNKLNAMCAIEAALALGVDEDVIQKAVESFKAISGRLEYISEVRGVKIYNDNSATTPDATIAGLRAIGDPVERRVVLIMGGDDKQLDMSELVRELPKWCSSVILFKERGTDTIRDNIFSLTEQGIQIYEEKGLEKTIERAFAVAEPGEIILYSPAFSSFGSYFKNEFDRGEQFLAVVKKLS